MLGPLRAGEIERGGHDVLQVDRGIAFCALGHAGAGDEEGHTHAVVVHVLLSKQAVMAHGEPVVRGEEDPRVVGLSAGIERIEDAADLRVEMRDERVILAAMRFDGELGARHRREVFIAQPVRAANVVFVRIFGQKALWHRDTAQRIQIEILLR